GSQIGRSGSSGSSTVSASQSAFFERAVMRRSPFRSDVGGVASRRRRIGYMISFNRISKQYGRQVLFVDASFQFNPGEKVGLVGPNGSGKTTLFRMIVGEETPDDG